MVKWVCAQLVYSHDLQNQVTFVVTRVFSTGSMLIFRVSLIVFGDAILGNALK